MNETIARKKASQAKRIVIKIGTNILMGPNGEMADGIKGGKNDGIKGGKNNEISGLSHKQPAIHVLRTLVEQVIILQKMGKEIVLVSSGAIGLGGSELKETHPIIDIPLRQACASVGQPILMNIYKEAFLSKGYHCAQILLTGNDFQTPSSYTAFKNCIEVLFSKNIIPIVNENDSISIDEIGLAFGDNDNLSAIVANHINADMLVIFTDVDGVYDKNPKKYSDAKKIPYIDKAMLTILLNEKNHFETTGSNVGTGGMKTKLQAASRTMESPCITAVVLGTEKEVLLALMQPYNTDTSDDKGGDIGTIIC